MRPEGRRSGLWESARGVGYVIAISACVFLVGLLMAGAFVVVMR